MCGIVGYLNLNGEPLSSSNGHLREMCDSIIHRGPDEDGMITIGPAALGMTRLRIIDLKTGQQPIFNEDKSICIVFNGEIYNFHELQKLVREKGHKLATMSDTEVIVHLYEEFGVDCLKHLEGMFSFAIWDNNKKRLFIARDRMGEKPLHWSQFDGTFIFSSEIKGILRHPSARRELNVDALRKYLALEYVPAPFSIFKGIHKLMPAHYMVVENGKVSIDCYWKPEPQPWTYSAGEAKERLHALLKRSIELRLISDVPLGVFLSGGIDSSTIAALASQVSSERLKTFSIGFADPSFDESEHAKAVADHLKTDHHVVTFLPELAYQTLEELWTILDEPLADASIVPTYFLSKMTKQHVTVALAGEGGDELFGGYPTYQAHKMASVWRRLPRPLRHNVLEPAIRNLPVSLNNLSLDYKAKRFISAVDEPPLRRHLRWMGSIPVAEQERLIRPDLIGKSERPQGEEHLFEAPGMERVIMPNRNGNGSRGDSHLDGSDLVNAIMRLDMSTYLPDDLLVKSDRASMAASLEVRLPFLAYPLVEFALSMPSDLKIRGMTTKYLLKQVGAPMLPPAIMKRPKKGFGIPVAKWLKGQFRPLVDELMSVEFLEKQGIFHSNYVRELLNQHDNGYADRRKELWTLLMFQWWWRKFFTSACKV